MKARWNQQSEQGACPSTSPMKSTASEAVKARSHASHRAGSPRSLSICIDPRAKIGGDLRRRRAIAIKPHERALGVEEEDLTGVPHRVAVRRGLFRDALVEDLEGCGVGFDLLRRAGEAQNGRMEL